MATTKKSVVRSKSSHAKKATKTTTNEVDENKINETYHCVKCGAEFSTQDGNFYKNTTAQIFEGNNDYIPICKNCLQNYFELNIIKYEDLKLATRLCCAVAYMVYDEEICDELIKTQEKYLFGDYVRKVTFYSKNATNFKKAYSFNIATDYFEQKNNSYNEDNWSSSEKHIKEQVLNIIGYDPFLGYSDKDRQFLFAELLKYLDDDELLSDTYKMSQILQLVNNNNQIKQCDIAISSLDPSKDSEELKNLINLKSNLVSSNDKIAKENRISVKNREGNGGGKGTITGLMREMREKNIDEIATSYYNQLKSPSSRWAAEVSAKALKENCYFDENDINDILYEQRELIQKLQSENDDLNEENRILNYKLSTIKDGEQYAIS